MQVTGEPTSVKKSESGAWKFWREQLRPLLVVIVVLCSVRSAVADWNDVPTGSMKPTILEGDRIFVNKLAYDLKVPFLGWSLVRWADPRRGEVVVFPSPTDGVRLVKRVVGLPGDRIELIANRLHVNGQPLLYEPLDPALVRQLDAKAQGRHRFAVEQIGGHAHPVMVSDETGTPFFGPVVVPPGHYFMMGDNRDNSLDSRFFGFVPRESIEGHATNVAISFVPGGFRLRWERFGSALD